MPHPGRRDSTRPVATARWRGALLALVALLATAIAPAPLRAAPPEEGDCPTVAGPPPKDSEGLVDAPPVLLKPGMLLGIDQLLLLRQLLPPYVWQHREAFFHEGMRMEIGPCHRRYPALTSYVQATREFRGQARLDERNNLSGYTAGLPFPPEDIDPDAKDAAAKWAWNLERRFRGAGWRGSFKITEIPARLGGDISYEGKFFLLQTSHRADLADSGYALPSQNDVIWASGGHFVKPFDARHLAWRQFRPTKADQDYDHPDNMFVYVPSMRKQRRAASTWVDGLFVPSYSMTGEQAGGGMAFGEQGGGVGAISPNAGVSIAVSQDKGRRLMGLTLRPNAYAWRIRGEQTVLAPINGSRPGFPLDDKRNYGLSGLSVASDRWDVRHAVIIEGALRIPNTDIRTIEIFVDWQTQQPLYWITRTHRRRLLDIGILVHRFSGDIRGYPEWPGGTPADVFEPVAGIFYSVSEGGGGWRRESYDVRSTPFAPGERRVMTSADNLGKGR